MITIINNISSHLDMLFKDFRAVIHERKTQRCRRGYPN